MLRARYLELEVGSSCSARPVAHSAHTWWGLMTLNTFIKDLKTYLLGQFTNNYYWPRLWYILSHTWNVNIAWVSLKILSISVAKVVDFFKMIDLLWLLLISHSYFHLDCKLTVRRQLKTRLYSKQQKRVSCSFCFCAILSCNNCTAPNHVSNSGS